MRDVPENRSIPNLDRISTISAMILLAYSLTGLIRIPPREISAQLPGFYFNIQIDFQTLVSLLVAGLAASGTSWLLKEHPENKGQRLYQHLLIPVLMAWIIGIPLYQRSLGPFWWLGILLGGGVLILVLVAEFIVVNPADVRYSLASIGLTAIAHALFFLLAVTLRASQLRLYLMVPALTLAIGLISLRTLRLHLIKQWDLVPSAITTLIVAEITTVAHYLPLTPVAFGLFLLGPAYGLNTFFGNLGDEKTWKLAIREPLMVLGLLWGLALWLR